MGHFYSNTNPEDRFSRDVVHINAGVYVFDLQSKYKTVIRGFRCWLARQDNNVTRDATSYASENGACTKLKIADIFLVSQVPHSEWFTFSCLSQG